MWARSPVISSSCAASAPPKPRAVCPLCGCGTAHLEEPPLLAESLAQLHLERGSELNACVTRNVREAFAHPDCLVADPHGRHELATRRLEKKARPNLHHTAVHGQEPLLHKGTRDANPSAEGALCRSFVLGQYNCMAVSATAAMRNVSFTRCCPSRM